MAAVLKKVRTEAIFLPFNRNIIWLGTLVMVAEPFVLLFGDGLTFAGSSVYRLQRFLPTILNLNPSYTVKIPHLLRFAFASVLIEMLALVAVPVLLTGCHPKDRGASDAEKVDQSQATTLSAPAPNGTQWRTNSCCSCGNNSCFGNSGKCRSCASTSACSSSSHTNSRYSQV